LVRVADVLHDAEIRLKNRVSVLEAGSKAKLITQRRASGSYVRTERDVNLVEHVVVEVVLVRSNARLLVRVNAERQDQRLLSFLLVDECINVGGVGRGSRMISGASM
jgi:hypothetical protein